MGYRNVRPVERFEQLPPRSQQIARLAVSGMSYDEIAAELGISYKTVAQSMCRVHKALGLQGRYGQRELREQVILAVIEADQRANMPEVLSRVTKAMVELYQVVREVQENGGSIDNRLLQRRIDYALELGQQRMREVKEIRRQRDEAA